MAPSPDPPARLELARQLASHPAGLLITCAGPSMAPTVRRGEQVRIRAVDPRRLRPGEVFLFETGAGTLEMHRLVRALPGGWLIHRGDHQERPGFGVTRTERVLGRAADLAVVPPSAAQLVRALAAVARRALHRDRIMGRNPLQLLVFSAVRCLHFRANRGAKSNDRTP